MWTRSAVRDLEALIELREAGGPIPPEVLTHAQQLTDANAVIFDAANRFAGCIPGIREVLRRQGLLEGLWTLNPYENPAPGPADELDRIQRMYPDLNDDAFVRAHLEEWLR